MKKKLPGLCLLIALIAFIVTACGQSSSNQAKKTQKTNQEPKTALELAKRVNKVNYNEGKIRVGISEDSLTSDSKSNSISNEISYGKVAGKAAFKNQIYASHKNDTENISAMYDLYMNPKKSYLTDLYYDNAGKDELDDNTYTASTAAFKPLINYDNLYNGLVKHSIAHIPEEIAKKATMEKKTTTKKNKKETIYTLKYSLYEDNKKVSSLSHKFLPIFQQLSLQDPTLQKALKDLSKIDFHSFSYTAKIDAKTMKVSSIDLYMTTKSKDEEVSFDYSFTNKKDRYLAPEDYMLEKAKKISDKEIATLSGL